MIVLPVVGLHTAVGFDEGDHLVDRKNGLWGLYTVIFKTHGLFRKVCGIVHAPRAVQDPNVLCIVVFGKLNRHADGARRGRQPCAVVVTDVPARSLNEQRRQASLNIPFEDIKASLTDKQRTHYGQVTDAQRTHNGRTLRAGTYLKAMHLMA